MCYWQFSYPKRLSFTPPDYESPGIGGSEAALILLTRELASRGHKVDVFNCCFRPGTYDGVRWRMFWEIDEAPIPDIAVVVRFEEGIREHTSKASKQAFWMLDDRPSGVMAFCQRIPAKNAAVVVASKAMLRKVQPVPSYAVVQEIPLPVETGRYIEGSDRELYCLSASMPNRGLDVTIDIWPEILEAVPDARLVVTGGWALWGYTKAEALDRWGQVLGGRSLPPNVEIRGAVSRGELCRLQQKAWLSLYPCRFPEMFCLAAAESCAAGTPMIASDLEALSERIENGATGVLIPGRINDPDVQHRFVIETTRLLKDKELRDRLGDAARANSQGLSTARVAAQWETLFC